MNGEYSASNTSAPLRIGIDTHSISSIKAAGMRTYTLELVRALLSIDQYNHYVLYAMGMHPFYQEVAAYPNVQVRFVLPSNGLIRNFWTLPRWIVRDQLDVIHLQFFLPLFVSAASVLTIHDLYYQHLKHPSLSERILSSLTLWSGPRSNYILTISEYSRQDILRSCAVNAERIRVIFEAAHSRFQPISDQTVIHTTLSRLGIATDYILFVGRTDDPRKNVRALIEAYSMLRSSGDIHHQLVIVGRHGSGTTAIHEWAHNSAVKNDIIFTGVVDDDLIPILMSQASLFVFVSSFEGFGLPVLEAMACGTPVITSNTTSLPEVGGDAVIQVTPGNVTELVAAIRQVLHNADMCRWMRERGLQRAEMFSWERAAHETLAIYRLVVQQQSVEYSKRKTVC